MQTTTETEEPLFFQDIVSTSIPSHCAQHEEIVDDKELSLAFFELANVNQVGFRLDAKQMKRKKTNNNHSSVSIVVQQDTSACGQHTGGIVWETCYLLTQYLLSRRKKLGKTLEVGAGCALLGQVLAASKWAKQVILTETGDVMNNLLKNVKRNESACQGRAVACPLDWQHVERNVESSSSLLKPHSMDTIVGTDVIFTPSLVEPLLHTLQYMSHEETVVYLCLQVRCPDSHKLLLSKAASYGWKIQDVSSELASIPDCAWGLQMECQLLKMTRTDPEEACSDEADTNASNDKKRKSRPSTDKKKRKKQ